MSRDPATQAASPYLDDALPAVCPLQADDLEQQVHDHGAIHVAQHIRHGALDRFEKLDHLLRLSVKQGLVDLCEVASLQRVERDRSCEEEPKLAQEIAAGGFHQRLADGPVVRGQDLAGDVGVLIPSPLGLLLVVSELAGMRRGAWPAKGQGPALAGVRLVFLLGGDGDRLEPGCDGVFEEPLEDIALS